jgi:predicted ArsR family transcriptional regulator
VLVKSGDGVTISDIVEAEGVSREQVRRSLVALSKQGRLEVTRVRRTDLAGRQTLVPAYKLKKAGK